MESQNHDGVATSELSTVELARLCSRGLTQEYEEMGRDLDRIMAALCQE